MATTLKDIAKTAGVSVSTVSFAIRGCQPGNGNRENTGVKAPDKLY